MLCVLFFPCGWWYAFLVAVLDVNEIPTQADICVNMSIYRVYFKADDVLWDDSFNPDADDLLDDDAPDGDNGLEDNGDMQMKDVDHTTIPPESEQNVNTPANSTVAGGFLRIVRQL